MVKNLIPDGSEIYFDGKNYDTENSMGAVNEDLPFYLKMAKKAKGSVLEIACGTGRLTIPIAKAGVDIMFSPAYEWPKVWLPNNLQTP